MTDIPIRGMTQDEVRELVEGINDLAEKIPMQYEGSYSKGINSGKKHMAFHTLKLLQSILAKTGEK